MTFRAVAPKRQAAGEPRSASAIHNTTIHHHRHEARAVEGAAAPPSLTFVTHLTRTANALVALVRDRMTLREIAVPASTRSSIGVPASGPSATGTRTGAGAVLRPYAPKLLRPRRVAGNDASITTMAFRRRALHRAADDGVPAELSMRPRVRSKQAIVAGVEPRVELVTRAVGLARSAGVASGNRPQPAGAPARRPAAAAAPMEWRMPAPKQADGQRTLSTRSMPVEPPAPAAVRPAASEPAVMSAPSRARETAGAIAIDAAAIDRLAETVMQRIDRRTRIERERRGV
jgi:hypothetical protein